GAIVKQKDLCSMDEAQAQESKGLEKPVEQVDSVANVSTERMLPQSEVDRLIAGIKREAFEKGQRAAKTGVEASNPQQVESPVTSSGNRSLGGMPLTEDHIKGLISSEIKSLDQQHREQTARQQA